MQKQRRFPLPSLFLIFLILGGGAPSCGNNVRTNMELESTIPPKTAQIHALHSEKLRQVMRNLQGLAHDRLPQELDVQDQRGRYFEEISGAADAMANAAGELPEIVPELGLTGDALGIFLKMAARLQSRALALGRHAAEKNLKETALALEEIKKTCEACHSLYHANPKDSPLP